MNLKISQYFKFIPLLAFGVVFFVGIFVFIAKQQKNQQPDKMTVGLATNNNIVSGSFDETKLKTDAEWKQILTSSQFHILREAGTEIPFTGELNKEKRAGMYYSAGCDVPLFRSEQKYDSGTGWPSFWAPIDEKNVVLRKEDSFGDDRIEVLDRCGGHLGHVFEDGPDPTGKRYCMNSAALKFMPD